MRDRRRFLAAVGGVGAAGVAGCLGGFESVGGAEGEPGGDPAPDPDNDLIPPSTRDFVMSGSRAATEFDAQLREETVLIEGSEVDAVQEADLDSHRYVVDESALGRELQEGSVLLISGVALRRITSVRREGSTATVETEFAPLTDAIEDGTVGWEAELGFDAGHSPDHGSREPLDGRVEGEYDPDAVALAGVGTIGADGQRHAAGPEDLERTGAGFKWQYTENNRSYTFALEDMDRSQATIRVEVAAPANGDANMALTAEGTVGTALSAGDAEIEDEELQSLEVAQDGLGVDLTLEIAGAGSGGHSIDWVAPVPFFKFVVTAGPVPVTFELKAQLIASAEVPAEASATASSEFEYRGESGISYEGSDVEVDASMESERLDPDAADSAGNIGTLVDLQFGLAFPRVEVSVFDSLLIPYVHTGTTIGSRLTWDPLCKSSYVRFVVQVGYDLEVFGVSLASEKETLYEDVERAYGDGCEESSRLGNVPSLPVRPGLELPGVDPGE